MSINALSLLFLEVSIYWMHRWYDLNSNWTLFLFCNITALERQLQLTYRPSYWWLHWIDITLEEMCSTQKIFHYIHLLARYQRETGEYLPKNTKVILGEGSINKENHFKYGILIYSHFLMASFLFNIYMKLFMFIFFRYYIFLLSQ